VLVFFELPPEQRPWIAALVARTQMEHLRLPAATSWHWLEAYGRLEADPEVVRSEDWNLARTGAGAALESLLSATELTEREQAWLAIADGADTALRADGRFQLAEVRLRLGQGDAAGAEDLLERGIELAGLREGANQLAELWGLVQQQQMHFQPHSRLAGLPFRHLLNSFVRR
jgi:hypothetical protein